MSAILLAQAIDYLRGQFTRAEVATVDTYGGEFTAAETDKLSFACPAIFVTVLGWQPKHDSQRLVGRHVHQVKLAAFVVFKHAQRSARLAGAMTLAERVGLALRLWVPDSSALPLAIAPLEDEARAENLYGRAIDAQGLALWLVSWEQCTKPAVPLPQLYDLISIAITDTVRGGLAVAATPAAGALAVTEAINFAPLS